MRRPLPTFRERLAGLVATLAIVAIVVAVPVLLWRLFGSPIPSTLPSGDVLHEPVTAQTLLNAIVILVWLAWLHFVVCLIVEAVSAVRNRGLPRPVPLGGASQPLARRLVVTALLLIAAVGVFERGADRADNVAGPRDERVVAAAPAGRIDQRSHAVEDHRAMRAAADAARSAAVGDEADEAVSDYDGQFRPGTKIYTVQPPKGRYHDNLWDIAERHLGDGRRYREIFELNKDREQPDGGRLQLARLIHPGWVLVMPDDARGVEVVPERPPTPEPARSVSPADADLAEPRLADPNLTVADDAGGARPSSAEVQAADVDEHVERAADIRDVSGRDFLAAGLLAAGLLSALSAFRAAQRRRRPPGAQLPVPDPVAAEVEVAMRLAADPDSGRLLQRALDGLAAACVHAGRPFPEVFAVKVDQQRIELLLAAPATDPPPPFIAADDGRSWWADRDAAFADLPTSARPPLPGLVGLGRDLEDSGRHVLVDLEAAAGPVAVTGELGPVRAFLTAAAAELATNIWSGAIRVTCVGLDDGLRALAPDRIRIAVDLDEEITRLEREASGGHNMHLTPGADAVITGRLGGERGELYVGEYLVLGMPPTPAQAVRLSLLARAGRLSSVGILAAGPLDGARWRIELDGRDRATVPVLGLEVAPQQLSETTLEHVLILARTAYREPEPPPAPSGAEPAMSRPAGGHLKLVDPIRMEPPTVEVRVLGPLEITGSTLDEVRRSSRTEELVAFLALCGKGDGVGRSELVTALWPGGASDESVAAALRRTRDWLGVDPRTFKPLLEGGEDGPWRLADSVQLDWAVFEALVMRSNDGDLRRALDLVRGGLLSGRSPGRFAWLARTSLEYDIPVLIADTAHRVARMALLHGDVETAAAAARKGLGVDRDSLALWRDLLEAERHRDPVVADRVAAAMRDRFARGQESRPLADLASGW